MKNKNLFLLIGIFLSGIFILGAPLIGEKIFYPSAYFVKSNIILLKIRFPQTLMAYGVGFLLSIVGLLYQTIFHNDLAGPYTLGVSSGSAFGAALGIIFFPFIHPSLFSLLFGLGVTLVLLLVYSDRKNVLTKMILLGVALNFFFASNILLLYYFSDMSSSFEIYHWLMGSINIVGYKNVLILCLTTLPFYIYVILNTKKFNILLFQKDLALSKGVNVNHLTFVLVGLSSILVSLAVAFTGPISFIGLMGPHITKQIVGKNHKFTLVNSGIMGGLLLVLCFTFSRIILFPTILPVGIMTGFLGSLFFVFLLFSKK